MDKKKLIKIIIPVCIVLVVAGIWVFKNFDFSPNTPNTAPPQNGKAGGVQPNHDADFALETTAVDLEALSGPTP